jgi:hypothetical protein
MQKPRKLGEIEGIIQGYGLLSALSSRKPMISHGRKLIGKLHFSYFKFLRAGLGENSLDSINQPPPLQKKIAALKEIDTNPLPPHSQSYNPTAQTEQAKSPPKHQPLKTSVPNASSKSHPEAMFKIEHFGTQQSRLRMRGARVRRL